MQDLWPDVLKPVPDSICLIPAIPKLHEPMHHQTDNHQQFSFNFIPGVGLTDGETPERVWAIHNCLGNSTKTQGPGSRHDVVDDHLNWWNFLKYIVMHLTLLRRYRAAVADRNLQVEAHKGLTASLSPGVVDKWESMCCVWESDTYLKDVPNPYMVEVQEFTESDVRKELAKEEEKQLKDGGKALHETSADTYIGMGIAIENAQRCLRRFAENLTDRATARQDSGLTEQQNTLKTRIRTWELLLPIYMPGLLQHQANLAKQTGPVVEPEHPEDFTIWLPSLIPEKLREVVCYLGLAEMEHQLCTSQCYNALKLLRHNLCLKSRLVKHKQTDSQGQHESTRSRTVINRVHQKACAAGDKYHWAREAKLKLAGPGEWEKVLKILDDDDIRSFQDAECLKPKTGRKGTLEDKDLITEWEEVDKPMPTNKKIPPAKIVEGRVRTQADGTGETGRTILWIWWMPRKPDGDDESDSLLMIEWAKSRA
ncbi:hypothetical protein BJ165DRAFT_1359078 [Panaeolus papilionaceus]|nr:hypothetical protein BJ165DRAFT_1359078 [Panaeolus papilionaceus]